MKTTLTEQFRQVLESNYPALPTIDANIGLMNIPEIDDDVALIDGDTQYLLKSSDDEQRRVVQLLNLANMSMLHKRFGDAGLAARIDDILRLYINAVTIEEYNMLIKSTNRLSRLKVTSDKFMKGMIKQLLTQLRK